MPKDDQEDGRADHRGENGHRDFDLSGAARDGIRGQQEKSAKNQGGGHHRIIVASDEQPAEMRDQQTDPADDAEEADHTGRDQRRAEDADGSEARDRNTEAAGFVFRHAERVQRRI